MANRLIPLSALDRNLMKQAMKSNVLSSRIQSLGIAGDILLVLLVAALALEGTLKGDELSFFMVAGPTAAVL